MAVDSPVISEPIGTRPVENVFVREEPIVPITQQPSKQDKVDKWHYGHGGDRYSSRGSKLDDLTTGVTLAKNNRNAIITSLCRSLTK